MPDRDLGVLPASVHRDPRAEAALVFVTLAEGLDDATVQSWLAAVRDLVDTAEGHQGRQEPYASAVIGLGQRFFSRFPGRHLNNPYGITNAPVLPPEAEFLTSDLVLHITYISEAKLADLLKGLWATRPVLSSIEVERGYARSDGREAFGQLDGVRNLSRDQRQQTTRIDRDLLPEEPEWLAEACYLAYLKIEQHLDAFAALGQHTQEQILGRRTHDGSRLDLPEGTDPKTEVAFNDIANPPANSHVRKAGPRGPLHDQIAIFRRGVPYVEEEGGVVRFGLQFVSYQASLDDFDVVLNKWMLDPNFPSPGSRRDALVEHQLISFRRGGVFVVVPHDDRYPGAGYFDAPTPPKPTKKGRIHIRKVAVDGAGNLTNAEIGGITFTLHDANGTQIGDPATTNPAGRARLPEVPLGSAVVIREVTPDRFQPNGDRTEVVDQSNKIVTIENTLKLDANPYD